MKKSHAVFACLVGLGVIGLAVSPMGFGIIGGGDGSAAASEEAGSTDSAGSTDTGSTGSGATNATKVSEEDIDSLEDLREANLTEEEIEQMDLTFDPEEVFGEFVPEEDLASFVSPVNETASMPPSIDEYVQADELRQRTFSKAEDGFTFNYHLSSTGNEEELLVFSGGIYDRTEDKGEYTTVQGDDLFERVYFQEDNAAMQLRNHIPQSEYEGEGAPIEHMSTRRPSMSTVLNFNLINPFLEVLSYEPVGQYQLPNNQVVIADAALESADKSPLIEMIPDAQSIETVGGRLQIDESGALLEFRGLTVYQTIAGDQEVLTVEATVEYGNHTDIEPPSWVTTDLMESPAVNEELSLNEEENYLLIQPDENLEAGTEIEIETLFGTKAFEVDRVEQGKALYVYFEDGELTLGQEEPRTLDPIGNEVIVTVVGPDGDMILAQEVSKDD